MINEQTTDFIINPHVLRIQQLTASRINRRNSEKELDGEYGRKVTYQSGSTSHKFLVIIGNFFLHMNSTLATYNDVI